MTIQHRSSPCVLLEFFYIQLSSNQQMNTSKYTQWMAQFIAKATVPYPLNRFGSFQDQIVASKISTGLIVNALPSLHVEAPHLASKHCSYLTLTGQVLFFHKTEIPPKNLFYTQNGYVGVLYWKDILLWLVDRNA